MKSGLKKNIWDRRQFVRETIRIVAVGSLLTPVLPSCNSKKPSIPEGPDTDTTQRKSKAKISQKQPRKKWHHESLVINSKTKVMHFPTSRVYRYYDEIKPANLQAVGLTLWSNQLQDGSMRFNKEQSGNIIEILTMQHLKGELNDTSLIMAIDTLSTAFEPNYEKENAKNFRLHELMLQLVTLNTAIPADQKWITFNAKVKRPGQLRKRQQWMANETNFNQRVNYIDERRNDYMQRLNKRASKLIFT